MKKIPNSAKPLLTWRQSLMQTPYWIGALCIYMGIIWVAWSYPDLLMETHWLTTVLFGVMLILSLTHWGTRPLGDVSQALPWWRYWPSMLLVQGIAFILVWAILVAFVMGGPPSAVESIALEDLWQAWQSHAVRNVSFPWGAWCFVAWLMGVVMNQHGHAPTVKHWWSLSAPNKEPFKGTIQYMIHFISIRYALMIMALMISAAVLLFSYVIAYHFNLAPHVFFPMPTLMGLFPMIVIGWIAKSKKWFRWRWIKNRRASFWIIQLTLVLLSLLLVIDRFGLDFLQYAELNNWDVGGEARVELHERADPIAQLVSLIWSLWLLGVPLAANTLLCLSRGRTLRDLLWVGVFCQALWWTVATQTRLFAHVGTFLQQSVGSWSILALMLIAILLYWVKRDRSARWFLQGVPVKQSPPFMIHSFSRHVPELLTFCAAILLLHGLSGWGMLQFKCEFIALESVLLLIYMLIFLPILLRRAS